MKTLYLPALCALVLSLAAPLAANAQTSTDTAGASATQPVAWTSGEIKRIDLERGRVTIQHGEIKNLDMPPMTMVFVAKAPSQLATLKAGNKVNFVALKEDGKYVAADIQPAQ